ncbi:FixH family protein [Microbulbifer celer]|uniref:FixH family protein n=1 Tax=Microbulbifer celer TaxID=435905 RepID=A0ABW3U399_9GAMM|nr:FixH family protein [Microbulbifer celer]UFN58190.1 FixH family protein [Microbulbifer celer]
MVSAQVNQNRDNNEQPRPWYREIWFWILMAPLIMVVIMSTIMVSIAVRYADDTVSDTYYKDSRLYHFMAHQDQRAAELGMAGMVQYDPVEKSISVNLKGDLIYPEQLLLTLSHPVEADLDTHVVVDLLAPGRYRGQLNETLQNRWYLQLSPELDPKQHEKAEWRLKGEINFNLGNGAPLNPAVQ